MSSTKDINTVWDRRVCPLCNSSKILMKPTASAKHPAEFMDWETAKSYFIGLRNDQVFFSYYRCIECELLYCPWYFNSVQIAELYAAMPDNTMGEDKSTVSRTQSTYARWIMKSNVSNKRYLEIGPDIGLVAKEIVKINIPEHVSFLEPNQSVKDELQKSALPVQNIKIVNFIENLNENNFTLVVGVHVYDHLLTPVDDLTNLRKKVQSGSHLAIVVHNEKSILRFILKAKWPPFCLQHPQLYSPQTLRKILQLNGWEVVDSGKSTNWYHLKYFVKMGAQIMGLPKMLSKIVPDVEIPVKLGNMICLARAD